MGHGNQGQGNIGNHNQCAVAAVAASSALNVLPLPFSAHMLLPAFLHPSMHLQHHCCEQSFDPATSIQSAPSLALCSGDGNLGNSCQGQNNMGFHISGYGVFGL